MNRASKPKSGSERFCYFLLPILTSLMTYVVGSFEFRREKAAMLQNSGVIRHSWAFLIARALRHGATLQAGEYRFAQPASVLEIFDRLQRGDVFYYELVVPEGKNMFDIAAAVERLGVFSAEQFLEVARDPAPIRDLDPDAPTLEGYLFPNTYRLSRTTTPDQLCLTMTGKFREVWRGLRTNASVHRTVTLASLVEKEGRLPDERPRALQAPLNSLESNWAYMVMTALAWNLKAWAALRLPEAGRWKEKYRLEKAWLLGLEFKAFLHVMVM